MEAGSGSQGFIQIEASNLGAQSKLRRRSFKRNLERAQTGPAQRRELYVGDTQLFTCARIACRKIDSLKLRRSSGNRKLLSLGQSLQRPPVCPIGGFALK